MSDAYEIGREIARETFPVELRETGLVDPVGMRAQAHKQHEAVAEVHTSYEEVPGGWRCRLYIPAFEKLSAEHPQFPDLSRKIVGEGPTKAEARDVALGWLQQQMAHGEHLRDRLLVQDVMRGRRIE